MTKRLLPTLHILLRNHVDAQQWQHNVALISQMFRLVIEMLPTDLHKLHYNIEYSEIRCYDYFHMEKKTLHL